MIREVGFKSTKVEIVSKEDEEPFFETILGVGERPIQLLLPFVFLINQTEPIAKKLFWQVLGLQELNKDREP